MPYFYYYCSITLAFLMGFLLKRKLTATSGKDGDKTGNNADDTVECGLKGKSIKENSLPKTNSPVAVCEKSCFTPAFSSLKFEHSTEIDEDFTEEYFHNYTSTGKNYSHFDDMDNMSKSSIRLWRKLFITPNHVKLLPSQKLNTFNSQYAFEGFKEFHTVKTWRNVSNFKPREKRQQSDYEKTPPLQIVSMFE